jgi:hypothetical protein
MAACNAGDAIPGTVGRWIAIQRPVDGPVRLGLVERVVAIGVGGTHACAILASGGVKCWGGNSDGQLGDGASGANQALPVDVAALGEPATALALGDAHTCALLADKTVKCWGAARSVGHGAASPQVIPLGIPELAGVASIAAGPAHTCASLQSGAAKCWGKNGAGQLGDGGTTDSAVAVDVVGLASGVAALSAGGSVLDPIPSVYPALERVVQLRADGGGRIEVLGGEQQRPAGRRNGCRDIPCPPTFRVSRVAYRSYPQVAPSIPMWA